MEQIDAVGAGTSGVGYRGAFESFSLTGYDFSPRVSLSILMVKHKLVRVIQSQNQLTMGLDPAGAHPDFVTSSKRDRLPINSVSVRRVLRFCVKAFAFHKIDVME